LIGWDPEGSDDDEGDEVEDDDDNSNNNNNNNNKKKKKKNKNNNNVKTRVIPVITGATGTISKSFRQYLSNISRNHDIRELQKTATLHTYCGKC
jgi:hypothetical protein